MSLKLALLSLLIAFAMSLGVITFTSGTPMAFADDAKLLTVSDDKDDKDDKDGDDNDDDDDDDDDDEDGGDDGQSET